MTSTYIPMEPTVMESVLAIIALVIVAAGFTLILWWHGCRKREKKA